MKYLDAYRDPRAARDVLDQIRRVSTRPWTLLEVCGGQARNLLRFGTDRALPEGLELLHGPSCPICATPGSVLDQARALALRPGTIVCGPGDLLRVPAGRETLLDARGQGADVRAVYSPLDALALARKHPERQVIALAVGFETTAPAAAAALLEAERLGLRNLTLLTSYVQLAPAVAAILATPGARAHAVLAAGPVCAVTGLRAYQSLSERFRVPVIITGPEPADLLDALVRAVSQLERGESTVENQYVRAVRPDGNAQALAAIAAVFESANADWCGLGRVPASGLVLRDRFRRFDAVSRFPEAQAQDRDASSDCREGDVVTGRLKPMDCPAFGRRCTPETALGAPMVSAEGVCAAYYRHRRQVDENPASCLDAMPVSALPGV